MQDNSTISIDDEALYLVGFCLSANEHESDLWTLITSGGDIDRAIVTGSKIIFFNDPELAPADLELADNDLKQLGPAPQEVVLVCNVPEMLRLVDTESVDETATILNSLNTFFDLLEAVKQPLPSDYKRILYPFADHLTFHREFGTFLEARQIDRARLREAIEWCIETIFSKSKFLSLQNWDQESRRNIPKNLFRATVKENGLKSFVEEMDGVTSEKIRRLFTRHFIGMKKTFNYAWEAFARVDKKIDGAICEKLPLILERMDISEEEGLVLMSDEWRDKICLKTQKKYLMKLIKDAWYPSDDLYIFDEKASWCIALTHHDFMIRAHSIPQRPVRKKKKRVTHEVFAVHKPKETYD